MRPHLGLSDALGLVELARHDDGVMRTPHHRRIERERGERDVRWVDQQIQSNLGGHEGTAILGTKDKEGA